MTDDLTARVRELIGELDDPRDLTRAAALVRLKDLDQVGLACALSKLVRSEDQDTRCRAATAMAKLDPTEFRKELLELLDHPDGVTRWHATGLLYDVGDVHAVPRVLRALVEDVDPNVRVIAANALGRIGDQSCLAALRNVATQDEGKDAQEHTVRESALGAIYEIEKRFRKGVPDSMAAHQRPLFRWDRSDLVGTSLDADSLHELGDVGIPELFDFSFFRRPQRWTGDSSGRTFAIFGEHRPVYYRLAADTEGKVWILGPGNNLTFANGTMGAFARCMRLIDANLLTIREAIDRGDPAELADLRSRLRSEICATDPASMEDESDWWPNVLRDI
jgi:SUKH-4 immunity protein/HEAT repeats